MQILMSVFGTIVAAFGIFGNLTTALILTRPAMRYSSHPPSHAVQ